MSKGTMKIENKTRRMAAHRLDQIFSGYARMDVDATTDEGATKVLGGWAVQEMAIDTLADRPIHCPDKPTKAEAAEALKWLLIEVPNNLSRAKVDEAVALVESMVV